MFPQELMHDAAFTIGEADEGEILAIEQREAQNAIASYTAKQKELQEQQQRLLLYEQVVRKRILEEVEKKEARLVVLKRQAEKQDRERQVSGYSFVAKGFQARP